MSDTSLQAHRPLLKAPAGSCLSHVERRSDESGHDLPTLSKNSGNGFTPFHSIDFKPENPPFQMIKI